jgi:hypothetical protein
LALIRHNPRKEIEIYRKEVALSFCDQELARLQAQAAAIQTARIAYAKALQAALPAMPAGDTLKFS